MNLLHLLPLLLLQAADPPRTVNDGVLGTTEEFATKGPARVCVGNTMVEVLPGETAYLDYLGIHWGAVRIVGPHGKFVVKEGDSWAPLKRPDLFQDESGRTFARTRRDGEPAYLLFAATEFSDGEEVPRVWISGEALKKGRASSILERVRTRQKEATGCDRAFNYGWDMLFGEESIEK
ncbi:hypothetical protein E2493_13320 [Sphingomonas parva]|uniref:Uncharacterized protein n=1 Tax=Sphingomonas parva TaxID=2555898 RepID=A0A4Y8ZP63_9SPHN|nr:hypothetical protein [Sphingomonas parva]TFI57800.1 hypothetical protein E2493_13320 [Sphingomonas parva]